MDDPERLIGKTLRDGRYAVCGILGSGSQGATLDAVDKRGGFVAIKRFQVRGARSWKDVELAEREARVLSQLSHPLLPRAIAHFEEDGALYFVMERIEGKSLAAIGTVPQSAVIDFLHDAADVLDYLHRSVPPVIHRDIKPGNIVCRVRGDVAQYVLVDFGSVRASLEQKGGSTLVGTFGYMAPEQLQGRAMPATDVYAVGATAVRMLTGIEPEDLPHRGLAIDVKKALGTSVDPALVAALEAMLAPDPDARAPRIRPLLDKLPRQSRTRPAAVAREPALSDEAKKKKTKKDKRAAKREEKRRRRRERAAAGAPFSLPPIARPFIIIAFAIARLAVSLVMTVAVPLMLTLLSVAFGPSWRRAAATVTRAGKIADDAMLHGRRRLLSEDAPAAEGPRVEPASPPEKSRFEERIDDALAEAEQEVDQAVEEIETEIRRKKRRR